MYIIAEIGINHNGDVEIAEQLISMAYGCGANAVKFQKRTIKDVYTDEFLASPRQSPWGTTQGEQKYGLEFGWGEYDQINSHCKTLGIDWFGSAWDMESLFFLDQYAPPYHKVASAFVTNHEFLHQVANRKRPVIMSTGGSTTQEILDAVKIFRDAKVKLVVMHCIMGYPVKEEDLNLSNIPHLSGMLPDCTIGYSGHTVGIDPTKDAMTLGAEFVEVHITLDRSMYGSDQSASIERQGLYRIVEHGKSIKARLGKPGLTERSDKEMAVAKALRYWED
jgi:N-acetylneuraminate synthase